jgi:hypothetical protein
MLDPHLIFIPLGKGESKGHLQNQVYATIRGFEQFICETASTRKNIASVSFVCMMVFSCVLPPYLLFHVRVFGLQTPDFWCHCL